MKREAVQRKVEDGLSALEAGGDAKTIANNVTNEIFNSFWGGDEVHIPSEHEVPRMFRGDKTFLEALELLRKDPSQLSASLSMAGGFIVGAPPDDERRKLGVMFSAAIFVAQMNLFPGTDYST